MSLDDIAAECGTTTEEQHDTESDRVHEGDTDMDISDVQNEYDGGWTNTNA
jgi:hypothetical protein